MTNSVLTSKLGCYLLYNHYTLETLLLENELDQYAPLNRIFWGKSCFGDDGNQNYLIFQPMSRYLKFVRNSQNISSWRSKELSDEEIKAVNDLYLSVNYFNEKLRLKLEGSCLAQTKVTYTHKSIVNIYIVYKIGATTRNSHDPKLINGLFGAVTPVKNSDINKFGYTGFGIGFDHNVLIFGVDISGSTHNDNKRRTY